jgi:hypothetical protein
VIEEIPLENDQTGHRQTMGEVETLDESWRWVRPDDRLSPAQQKEWDRVLDVLSNVGGEDLRHVVCFAGLLDHCKQIPSD